MAIGRRHVERMPVDRDRLHARPPAWVELPCRAGSAGDFPLVFPQRRATGRIHRGERSAAVHEQDSAMHQRRDLVAALIQHETPGLAEALHVAPIDLLQGAETRRVEGPAPHQPVALGRRGQHGIRDGGKSLQALGHRCGHGSRSDDRRRSVRRRGRGRRGRWPCQLRKKTGSFFIGLDQEGQQVGERFRPYRPGALGRHGLAHLREQFSGRLAAPVILKTAAYQRGCERTALQPRPVAGEAGLHVSGLSRVGIAAHGAAAREQRLCRGMRGGGGDEDGQQCVPENHGGFGIGIVSRRPRASYSAFPGLKYYLPERKGRGRRK